MANYLIQPESDHTADPTDLTNATWAFDVSDPGTVSGLTNGTAYVAREFVLSPASASFTPAVPATAPAQMSAPSLAVDSATQITATLAADPADGGSPITSYDLRYSTDEATWTDVIGVTSPEAITGLTASTLYYVQTRAVNAVGAGAWSASASATTDAAATAPAAFTSGQWTAATGSGASEIDIDITALPSDGGSAITALQYSTDAGATWAALTGTGTGSRTVDQHSDGTTGTLTASTSYDVMVRAVNAIGSGPDSDTKATTTGAASGATQIFFDDFDTDDSANYVQPFDTDGVIDTANSKYYSLGGNHTNLVRDLSGSINLNRYVEVEAADAIQRLRLTISEDTVSGDKVQAGIEPGFGAGGTVRINMIGTNIVLIENFDTNTAFPRDNIVAGDRFRVLMENGGTTVTFQFSTDGGVTWTDFDASTTGVDVSAYTIGDHVGVYLSDTGTNTDQSAIDYFEAGNL